METRSFIYGLVVAFIISGILYFLLFNDEIIRTGEIVKANVAHASFIRYYDQADTLNARLKGFMIDNSQFLVMKQLAENNSSLYGFRMYMGIDDANSKVCLLVGVDAEGKDITSAIYSVLTERMGPCPNICDDTSPITSE